MFSRFRRVVVLGPITACGVVAIGAAAVVYYCTAMPGRSRRGPLPMATPSETTACQRLAAMLHDLAGTVGERNATRPGTLAATASRITAAFVAAGYEPVQEVFDASWVRAANVYAETDGDRTRGIIVVGAHYDTVPGSPGADDNGSGVAAMLEMARALAGRSFAHPIRFIAFANEEEPYFGTATMGSQQHLLRSRERGERVVAMLSLETLGYYDTRPGSQRYPFPVGLVYPSTGDFVAFVSNVGSRALVRRVVGLFRESATIPSEGGALPAALPGVGWSDHAPFFEAGIPAVMVTDTAPFRNPNYHLASDLPHTLDIDRLARVVVGLEHVVAGLASERL